MFGVSGNTLQPPCPHPLDLSDLEGALLSAQDWARTVKGQGVYGGQILKLVPKSSKLQEASLVKQNVRLFRKGLNFSSFQDQVIFGSGTLLSSV